MAQDMINNYKREKLQCPRFRQRFLIVRPHNTIVQSAEQLTRRRTHT